MRPEIDAVYRSPQATLEGAAATPAIRQAIQISPICLTLRSLDPGLAAALDALPVSSLPRFDLSGTRARVADAIAEALRPPRPGDVLSSLRDDILDLVDLYSSATGSREVRTRLQVVDDDMCRAFHTDNVAFRLVTTYRGPGTQWLAPTVLRGAPDGQPLDPDAIRQMPRGAVAILRGGKGATAERPGLLHRSPPIAGTGMVRLFLAIDEGLR